jgi:peroxiredoxin
VRNPWRSFFWLAASLAIASGPAAGERAYALQGQGAPDFALKATSGTNFRLSENRGDVVLLAFWGSRCGQCGAQLAAVSRLVDTYRSAGLAAFAVNVDDNQLAAVEYAIAHPVSFPVLLDPEKNVARSYRVDNLPMLVFIDRAGTIRHVHRDHRSGDAEQFLERIKPLLDE